MRELSVVEIDEVSGGRFEDSVPYFTTMIAVGMSTFGSSWGAVGVGLAIAVAPAAVGVMSVLAVGGGIALMRD